MITPEQIRAARALLRLEQEELARRAGISISTVRRIEASGGHDLVAMATVESVRLSLEEAGVEFIMDGVLLKPKGNADRLYSSLRAIAERSAAALAADAQWTESDLYDESGLPA